MWRFLKKLEIKLPYNPAMPLLLWYIHAMEYYSAIKKNAFESVLMRWMKLGPIIQSDREGNGTPLQYSCLENPMGGGAW